MATNKTIIDSWSKYSIAESEKFGEEGDFSRQFILNETIFDLTGNPKGKKILDAGCGTGYLSRLLAKKGAQVTGVEPAQKPYKYCLKKEKEQNQGIKYLQADLSELSEFKEEFDVVVSNMVFMDIPDYKTAIKNCISSLKKGGLFIFSISHPAFPGSDSEWKELGYVKIGDYFDPEPAKQRFGISFDRPISEYVNFVIGSGCSLQKIVEPRLPKPVLEKYPETTRNYFVPQFVIFKFQKNG